VVLRLLTNTARFQITRVCTVPVRGAWRGRSRDR